MSILCLKEGCKQQAMSKIRVNMAGKNGEVWEYDRFVHYNKVDKRKEGRQAPRTYHYVRVNVAS